MISAFIKEPVTHKCLFWYQNWLWRKMTGLPLVSITNYEPSASRGAQCAEWKRVTLPTRIPVSQSSTLEAAPSLKECRLVAPWSFVGTNAPIHRHFHLSACINRLKLLGADWLLRKSSDVRVGEDHRTTEEETITRPYENKTGSDLDKQNELRYDLF